MNTAVLFDIDGTILRCHGAGKASLIRATEEVFGTCGHMERVDFQGKTDPIILHESLAHMGFDEESIRINTDGLKRRYFEYLGRYIYEYEVVLLPGVVELIEALRTDPEIAVGLLTGNFRESASIKLSRHDLNRLFHFGVYGDDASVRNELPAVARRRILEELGVDIPYDRMYIIGDTVHDIACAQHAGAVSIAVGTGWSAREKLLEMNPDHYRDDLSDTEGILRIIRGS